MAISNSLSPVRTLSQEDFWHHHLEQWRESGLSLMAYCHQHALVYHQMIYWSRQCGATPNTVPAEQCDDRRGFIPVKVTGPSITDALSLRLPNGIEIRGITRHTVSCVGDLLAQL